MIYKIIFFVLLTDSITANIIAHFGRRWYAHYFRTISRALPVTPAWALYYLVLVLWIGAVTWRIF